MPKKPDITELAAKVADLTQRVEALETKERNRAQREGFAAKLTVMSDDFDPGTYIAGHSDNSSDATCTITTLERLDTLIIETVVRFGLPNAEQSIHVAFESKYKGEETRPERRARLCEEARAILANWAKLP